ncbi:MAG TPA: hydroxymethylbilane synthase, partial [Nitrospirae bacterium]|nr:hydroxymethylbilane synthase [Nitrospirota bacterium]
QGAVGIECRTGDDFINNLIMPLNHEDTSVCVRAERAFLKRLEGGCQVPVGAYARLIDGKIVMDGLVGSVSGEKLIREQMEGDQEIAESIGIRLAEDLLSRGAKEILDSVYGRDPSQ